MDEKKLSEQISAYRDLAKDNPNVNVASLVMSAMQSQPQDSINKRQKYWAYLVSVGAPPLGLFYALKFFLSDRDKSDFKTVFWLTIALNVFSIVIGLFFLQAVFNSVPGAKNVTTDQLKQLPSDYRQLLQ